MDLYEAVRSPMAELEEPEPLFAVGDILESKKNFSFLKVLYVYTGPSVDEPAYLVLNISGSKMEPTVHGFKQSNLTDHWGFKRKETWTF